MVVIITSGNEMPISRLTSKGQTTIPKSIRDALRLKTGDRIEFILEDGDCARLRPINRDISSLDGILFDPNRKPVSIEEMNEAIAEAAVDRYLRSK